MAPWRKDGVLAVLCERVPLIPLDSHSEGKSKGPLRALSTHSMLRFCEILVYVEKNVIPAFDW